MVRLIFSFWVGVATCIGLGQAIGSTFVPKKATWRYVRGTAEASSPPNAWRAAAFDDAKWETGPAPFHYGESIAGGTTLSDMRYTYSSVFLRHTFHLTDPKATGELRLRALCDDGFIAWINGVEVARFNMPAGDRPYNSFASRAISEPATFAEYVLPPPAYLTAGPNVLAVQVFNTSLTSSDLQWEGELIGAAPDTESPRILSIDPPPGAVESPLQLTITFTEPVTAVQASDLFLGPQSAATVSGDTATYTFSFDSVTAGTWELRWDADTLITDLANPANRFDPVGAGTWIYNVVDHTPPSLVDVTPRPGITLRSLNAVEIRFSEPVTGIDASDLLLDGIAASSVTGSLSGPYRFQFSTTPQGRVEFSWATAHGIRDLADPANLFTPESWFVEIDPNYEVPLLRINEFLASNNASTGLKDEDGDLNDWIELFNDGPTAVNLEGWSLTDDRDDPRRWVFPAVTLQPGRFLVIFASEKDRRPAAAGAKLHTNFKLSPEGEYLGLLNPEPIVVSEFDRYPEQRNDYSYGYDPARQLRYFRNPTPGAANATSSILGIVPPPSIDVPRGWFTEPVTVTLNSSIPGVTYRYTTDGSEPTESNGQIYSAPLRISTTTTLRIVGFKSGLLPSTTVTHTCLFADDILRQSNNPPGFPVGPTVMAGYPSDYEMDPEIVNDPNYRGILNEALMSLPVMSIVMKTDDLFSPANGIYTHPTSRGPAWERPCSVEFIPIDGSKGFQVNAGIQIQGNAAREPQKQPKHPLRLVFKADYGPRHLDYRLFPDSPIDEFDTLVLRADFNYSWLHWNPVQRIRAQRTRDAWMKDTMRAMGGLASHNRYLHLFINGLYWGIYDPSERPDGSFGAAYLGGEKEDYDIINEGAVVDGTSTAYNAMLSISNLADPSAYARMQQYLDLTQFIDYMLLHFYAGHNDWGRNKNWYTVRPRDGSRGFLYVPWDGEMILDDPNFNRVTSADTPSDLHSKLRANAEYRLAFADRAHKHLFNNGALTPEPVSARWRDRANQISTAIVAESARWGDYRRDVHPFQTGPYQLYTRDNQWRTEQERLLTQYFPRRTSILLSQLKAAGLYPDVTAPDFNQFGGRVEPNFKLMLSAPSGTIYFTTDGTDPRLAESGAISANAREFSGSVPLTNSVWIKARTFRQGAWSALAEAQFKVAEFDLPIRFTEIMYNPPGGDSFEFVELQNIGTVALDIGGFSFGGINFVFPHGTILGPGQIVLLASDVSPSAFRSHYPNANVTGHFSGSLSNGGERIELRDRNRRVVTAVVYDDDGAWSADVDGKGFSIEIIDPSADPNDPANWLTSSAVDGSPGRPSSTLSESAVRLSEITAASSATADWIELANTSTSPADIGGWIITDHNDTPFKLPPGTGIPAGGFLRIWCDALTNAPGLHAPFQVNRDGETIGLFDLNGRRLDAVTFGYQPSGYSISRIGNSGSWELSTPTPEAANRKADAASPAQLKLNEWMANPIAGEEDWIEIYNPDSARPAALKGLFVTTGNASFKIQSLVFIPAGGFIQLIADERGGPHHLGFKLPAAGGSIALLNESAADIDRISYSAQSENVSSGRLTDGGTEIGSLPNGPTPGRSNTAPAIGADSDSDGLPDEWETANGTNPLQSDADSDPDNDGLTNLQEFLAGTSPTDPASSLQVNATLSPSGSVVLQFQATPNRTYRVEFKESVADSVWTKLADIAPQQEARVETVTDPGPVSSARFYRVIIPAAQN